MSNVPPMPLGVVAWPSAAPAIIAQPASGSGGGANTTLVSVDFGSGKGDTSVTTAVTGLTWVTAASSIACSIIGTRAEDAVVEELTVAISDIVDGDGFTVQAASPLGSVGVYVVACVGV